MTEVTSVERLLDHGTRMTIVDPLGVWWGLRASADAAAAGYPVVVFGGRHADVPIDEGMGAALGRLIAREPLACVVDMSELGRAAAFHDDVRGFQRNSPAKATVVIGDKRRQQGIAFG